MEDTDEIRLDGTTYQLRFHKAAGVSRFTVLSGGEVVSVGRIDGEFNPPAVTYEGCSEIDRRITVQLQSRWVVRNR